MGLCKKGLNPVTSFWLSCTVSTNQNPCHSPPDSGAVATSCSSDHIKASQASRFLCRQRQRSSQLLPLTQLPRATCLCGSKAPGHCRPAKPRWMCHSRDTNSQGVIGKGTGLTTIQFLCKHNVNDSGQGQLHKNLGNRGLTSVLLQAAALEDTSVLVSL